MPATKHSAGFRSGFVAILGRPNAGKSTLLNALVGSKLAIVSSKPQTTRTSIQGVLTTDRAQVIFVDTPGVHQASVLLQRRMIDTIQNALDEPDLILWMADVSRPFESREAEAASILREQRARKFLLLNKIDRIRKKHLLLPLIEQYRGIADFAETFPVSAETGEGLDGLLRSIIQTLPKGPRYFPQGQITDQPERFLAAELIRESVLDATRDEVPHSVAVLIDQWEESPRIVRVAATIYVERPGQKRIIVGQGGAMLKGIGTKARLEMERLLGRKVFLETFVKVRPGWRESPEFLNEIDWRQMAGGERE